MSSWASAKGVLDGLAGVDELQLDLLLIGPVIEHPARQFRSVVEHHLLRTASFGDEPLQHLDHAYPWKRGSNLDGYGSRIANTRSRRPEAKASLTKSRH